MTNRDAFNLYLRANIENSVRSVEDLPNIAFYLWQNDNKNAICGVTVNRKLSNFWFTYGGRDVGYGVDNVVKWLDMEFKGDIEAEKKKWEGAHDDTWTKFIMEEYCLKGK